MCGSAVLRGFGGSCRANGRSFEAGLEDERLRARVAAREIPETRVVVRNLTVFMAVGINGAAERDW